MLSLGSIFALGWHFLAIPRGCWHVDVGAGCASGVWRCCCHVPPLAVSNQMLWVQQREAPPLSLGPYWQDQVWQEVHGAMPPPALGGWNLPPLSCVEQHRDVFAFQASLVVEMHFSITQRTGLF